MGLFDLFFGKKGGDGKPKAAGKAPASAKKDEPRKDQLIGEVEGYFRKPGVAVIKIKKGPLSKGDTIWIKGHTTDLKFAIDSMQIDHQPVEKADKRKSIGLKVKKRVRGGDLVYRTTSA